jgi:hypothetical protein
LTGGSLRRCNTRNEANLGSEVHLRDRERRGTVCDSCHGYICRRSTGCGSAVYRRNTDGRRSTGHRSVDWHTRRRDLRTTCGHSRRSVVEGVLGAVGNETRVLRNVLSANTDKVLKSLLGLLVGLAPCLDAVDDVLGELGVLAVAVGGSVVLAVLGADLEPSVHAGRKNVLNFLGGKGRRWVAWSGCLSRRRRRGCDTSAPPLQPATELSFEGGATAVEDSAKGVAVLL